MWLFLTRHYTRETLQWWPPKQTCVRNLNKMAMLWILQLVVGLVWVTGTTGQECYRCNNMRVLTNLTLPGDEVIRQIAPGLRDYKCRRADSNTDQNQQYPDYGNNINNNNNNWNTGTQTSNTLYTYTCPPATLGAERVVRCGVWEGTLYATVFNTRQLVISTFSYGCAEVGEQLTYGCHSRSGETTDLKHFRDVLYGSFRENVMVNDFQGTLCLCKDAACQRLVGGAKGKEFNILLILASFFVIIFVRKRF